MGDRPVPFSCGEGGVDTVHARRGKVSGQISGLFPDARLTLKVSQPVTPAPPHQLWVLLRGITPIHTLLSCMVSQASTHQECQPPQ